MRKANILPAARIPDFHKCLLSHFKRLVDYGSIRAEIMMRRFEISRCQFHLSLTFNDIVMILIELLEKESIDNSRGVESSYWQSSEPEIGLNVNDVKFREILKEDRLEF